MSINIESSFTMRFWSNLIAIGALATAAPVVGFAESGDEVRTSVSTHIADGGRDNAGNATVSADEYSALETAGTRNGGKTRAGNSKPGTGSTRSESSSFDFWFYDVDVQLFNDDDLDGFYHGIDVLFDIDTNFAVADVYAVLYLSYEGGPWNEYAVTDDFTIFDTSGSDEYVLVSELMSGYPTGSYDLLIEVFDSFDGVFLASFGPDDSSAASFLPLEDFNRDTPASKVTVVVSEGGGGGAVSIWLFALLSLVLLIKFMARISRKKEEALVRIDPPSTIWRH